MFTANVTAHVNKVCSRTFYIYCIPENNASFCRFLMAFSDMHNIECVRSSKLASACVSPNAVGKEWNWVQKNVAFAKRKKYFVYAHLASLLITKIWCQNQFVCEGEASSGLKNVKKSNYVRGTLPPWTPRVGHCPYTPPIAARLLNPDLFSVFFFLQQFPSLFDTWHMPVLLSTASVQRSDLHDWSTPWQSGCGGGSDGGSHLTTLLSRCQPDVLQVSVS